MNRPRSGVGTLEARARATLAAHRWPLSLLEALRTIRAGGHEAFLVGGTVRDVLLGRPAHGAFDVATDLHPDQVTSRFDRVEPLGIQHGTVLILLQDGSRIECTTFRREGRYTDARHPETVEFTTDPVADLSRRDLTINALAYSPEGGAFFDPSGGLTDLDAGLLRAVGDPVERFTEDALRPVRVARLAAVLDMEVEPATLAALGCAREAARGVAVERVREELVRLMAAARPSVGIDLLRGAALLELWMPELQRCVAVPQNRFHAFDVYWHSLRTCDAAPVGKPRVRWAALLHDLGKPDTRVERHGEGTFYNHQFVGADLADRLLERMRWPLDERRVIVHLVREHMFDYRSGWGDAALRRWVRRVGVDAIADLFDLRIADAIGNGLRPGFPAYLEEMRERIEFMLAARHAITVRDLKVDGDDVMRVMGIFPGPEVGAALEALLEEVLEAPERNRREHLLARLERRRMARTGAGSDA